MMTLLPEVSPKAHRGAISRFLDSVGRELFFGRRSLIAAFLTRFARWRLHLTGISSRVGRWSRDQALTTFPVIALDIATGNVLWNVPVVGTAPFLNVGEAVVADPNTGAAIAVGVTQNDRTSFDLTITSITEGHENWRQIISGCGKRVDRDDAALAIVI